MSAPTPRVNSHLLSSHTGKQVVLVGRVKDCSPDMARVEAADGADVTIKRHGASDIYGSTFVEIIGTVNPDRSVDEISHIAFKENFDLAQYNEAVLMANGKFKALFAQ